MPNFFNIDNPIWKFIGNLWDFFVLSVLWLVCSIPIVTIGASTTALYYVTLKMASDQEGKLWQQFFHSFRQNWKEATVIWLGLLAVGIVLGIDLFYGLTGGTNLASAVLVFAVVAGALYLCLLSFVFPLLARVDNKPMAVVKMAGGMLTQNFLPILAGVMVMAGFVLVGLFVFKLILLVVPALPAWINSRMYNRILERYHLNLVDQDPTDTANSADSLEEN